LTGIEGKRLVSVTRKSAGLMGGHLFERRIVMANGYAGKVLHVDLTNRKVKDEPLPGEKVLKSWLGCWGIALRQFYDMAPPGIEARAPENPMVFWNGPLTAVGVPGDTNISLATKNFNTGYTAGRSHAHGRFGINLKRAGYDGLIVTGGSEEKVYLFIHDNGVEIRDADYLWGKDTHETEEILLKELGKEVSVAAIGPAGENLVSGGAIFNDLYHSFAHSGVGSVMGSKRLKAIVTQGSGTFPIAHPERIRDIRNRWAKLIVAGARWKRGHHGMSKKTDFRGTYMRFGGFVGRNFQTDFEEFGLGTKNHKIKAYPCGRCPYACSADVELVSGPHKGMVATLSGGAEGPEGAGAIFGIANPEHWLYILELYDRMGIEASAAGCTMAMAIEAYQKGILTRNDTDGLELKWGDPEVVEKMLRKMTTKEGFGAVLALGPLGAARAIGGDAPNFAVHLKGSGMNLHDWRGGWGMFLSHIISGGSGWPATAADMIGPEPDAGYPEFTPHFDYKSKGLEARKTGVLKFMRDTLGVCGFMTWNVGGANAMTLEALEAVTVWKITEEKLLDVGERVMNLERVYNIRNGLTPADDYEISPRLLEAPDGGRAMDHPVKPYLTRMIDDYYRLMGWDLKTGKPWRKTLKRLGLNKEAKDIWG
jgi:aldehyde:ferredoxin oxidoreductase